MGTGQAPLIKTKKKYLATVGRGQYRYGSEPFFRIRIDLKTYPDPVINLKSAPDPAIPSNLK